MKLENEVCNVKLAKELKKLGAKQDAQFYWVRDRPAQGWESSRYVLEFKGITNYQRDYGYSAFTVAEFGELLPDQVCIDNKKYFLLITKTKKTEYFNLPDYYVGYKSLDKKFLHTERDDREADVRAKMLIYLYKNKLIEVEKS